jgi:DNA-binding response OmpR family regulator
MSEEPGVLIVDDDETIRYAVRELCALNHIPVLTASGADECIARLKDGFQGVVLMDVMMPGKDGWDTIREVVGQGLFGNILIAMLTAKDSPDQKMEGLQEYVIDYITKPFEPDELIDTIRRYFEMIQARKA